MMKVKQFVTLELPTILSKEYLECYRNQFLKGESFIIIDTEGTRLGVVSPFDYFHNPKSIAESVDFRKYSISASCKIREALMFMSKSDRNTMSVFDGDNFIGVIASKDLFNFLLNENSGYKLLFKNTLRTLRKPIANILGIITLLEKDVTPAEMEEVVKMSSSSCKEAFSILKELESLNKPQSDLATINNNLDEIYYK